jgi:D-beta-D-heptose 7-phosphate kinase/D-beta-D-heptose 1-phosphate adenosyltransferase
MATKTSPTKPAYDHRANLNERFVNGNKLIKLVENLKKEGKKIVLTQGVYDLIHEGHARYLEAAREYGDVLIVGVDSDELTRVRKGPNRPIVPQKERVHMLVHLRSVDIVTLREAKDEIGDLIRLIKPHVYVASQTTKDFTKALRDAYKDYCGKIVVLPPQAVTSTSARVRNLTIEGAEGLAEEIKKMTHSFLEKIRNS